MPELITLKVNDVVVSLPAGSMIASAVLESDATSFRRSVTGEPRGPLCGMGICFECRLTVNGVAHVRSCQTVCENGMDVRTDE